MDEDGTAQKGFRLPESLAESGDPVEANPYPVEHPAHQVWIDATRQAEMEVSRINADASSLLTPATAEEWMPTLVVAKFDVWARRGAQVVWTDDDVLEQDAWLVRYANTWIESTSRLVTSRHPAFPAADRVLAELRRRLASRVHHWKAEARRYRLQQEEQAAAAAPELHRRPSPELVERRRRAVQRYRRGHDLSAAGFARKVGISETAITGIIREERKRFSPSTQEKLLDAIGMTREEWYRE
jgi:hypothetical protein